jgi:uridine kinase
LSRAQADRVVVLALDGRSGAGKSMLASAVAGSVAAAVIHGDDFYRDMDDTDRRKLSTIQSVDRYIDWQRLRNEALPKQGVKVTVAVP